MTKKSFFDLSFTDLTTLFLEKRLNLYGAQTLFNWHYKLRKITPCEREISKEALSFLKEEIDFSLPTIKKQHCSQDGTVKFLIEMSDGATVESVLLPFNKKYSLCLSTQVGCAMNCNFCFTATQGFRRHLTTSEIIGQYLLAWNWLLENRPDEDPIKSLVFMGQGEPLHNFEAVKKACEIFLCRYGTCLGSKRITVSTSGYLPGIKKFLEGFPPVNIALSLHSAFDEKRTQLIPLNKTYPLQEIMSELKKVPLGKKQYLNFEYMMIKDFNDSDEDAHKMGELLKDYSCLINLIPFNPIPTSNFKRPERERLIAFIKILETYRIPTMIRETKGDDISAACGQLNTQNLN